MNNERVTVCLYAAIAEQDAYRRRPRPALQKLKSTIKNGLNRFATRVSGSLILEDYHYLGAKGLADNSNRGDIAIAIAIRQEISKIFIPVPVDFIEYSWGSIDSNAVKKINRNCDLFIIAGGGYIFIDSVGHINDRIDESFLRNINCPIVAYGIGLNRLMHEKTHPIEDLPSSTVRRLASFKNICSLIGVRDFDTKSLFDNNTNANVMLIGDPVLNLTESSQSLDRRAKSGPVVGINLAADGWRAIAVLRKLLPSLVPFLADVRHRYNAEFVYFLHHELERPVISFLRDRGFHLRVVDTDPVSMIGRYKEVDILICQMLHSCIFAANAGVPFMNIAYDNKSLAFASLLGIQECSFAHHGVDKSFLMDRFEKIYDKRVEITSIISQKKNGLLMSRQEFNKQIFSLIN